jgi:hypothetical protein
MTLSGTDSGVNRRDACELTPQSTLMTVISVPSKELLSERVATFTHVHDELVGALGVLFQRLVKAVPVGKRNSHGAAAEIYPANKATHNPPRLE